MKVRLVIGVLCLVNASMHQENMYIWLPFMVIGVYYLLAFENGWDE